MTSTNSNRHNYLFRLNFSQNQIFPLLPQDSTPDLLNFTTFQIPVDAIIMFNNSLKLMIGFTNDTRTVVDRTKATTLIPGTNLFCAVSWELRQLQKSPRLSLPCQPLPVCSA